MKNKLKKSCKNCGILKELHKIGRDCNTRIDPRPERFCNEPIKVNCCQDWINGYCRNNLKVKIES